MSESYEVKIVKFDGSFDDMKQLNDDLRTAAINGSSEFMSELREGAIECGIQNVNLFGITKGYYCPGNLGLIGQSEGCIENEHFIITRYYIIFDNAMNQIIADHLTENSKLVISFHFDVELYFLVYEKNKFSIIKDTQLF